MKYLIALLFVSSCVGCPGKQQVSATVVEVGGCDKDGECGVMYSNGIKGRRYFPVKGESVMGCPR